MVKSKSSLQKDSAAVTEALDQLREVGWAKQWSSQPYVSRRTVSPQLQSVKLWESAFHQKLSHKPQTHACMYINYVYL